MEAHLSAHIRHLLLDYVRYHITTDYVQFTEAALVSLKQVPEYDPASLTLPSDPYATLSHIHDLENILLWEEKFTTTQDALQLLKKSVVPKGQTKSEWFSWGRDTWDEYQDDFYRVESILTRRAVRETPVLGKSGGAHRAPGIQKVELDSYARLLASKPIAFKSVDVEPVQEPQIKLNQVLDVSFNLKAADHAAVRAYLQSVATMCRPQPVTSNDLKRDYRRAYLPAGFVFDPPRPATTPPNSPPLTPIFPRSTRYKRVENQDIKNRVLCSYVELPQRLGVAGEAKLLDLDGDMDLARASMVVVDGWQTYAVSSPTTVSSIDDAEFDELADMFPSSPDTSIVDAMNLVEDVENSKLDEVQIPKNRRIRGSLGMSRESIVDRARKAGGLGAFLVPLLKPSDSTSESISTPDLHPLLHDNWSILSRGNPKGSKLGKREGREGRKHSSADILETATDIDSICGQVSAAPSLGGGTMTEEDNEIQGLYLDLSRSGERRLGPPLPRDLPDPKALIRDEPLFEEETKGVKENNALTLKLMKVPVLPDPNISIKRGVREYSDYLVGVDSRPQGDGRDGKAGKSTYPLRFLKNTKGLAPLRVALSWVAFTSAKPIPVHAGLFENDFKVEEAVKSEADALLKTACTDAVPGGCGFGDEPRWRTCGQEETGDEFSEEVGKCEIILTKKERKALLMRERGMVEDEFEAEEASEDAGNEQGDKKIEMVNNPKSPELDGSRIIKRSTQTPGHCEKENDHRPMKRARMSADDSVIGMMLELDGPLRDLDGDQDVSLDTADNMLQDIYQNDNYAMTNGSKANNGDENIKQAAGTVIESEGCDYVDAYFGNTDDCSSEMVPTEDELPNYGRRGLSDSLKPLLLSNGSYDYTQASVTPFSFADDSDTMLHLGQSSADATLDNRDQGILDTRMAVDLNIPQHAVATEANVIFAVNSEGNDHSGSFKDTCLKSLNFDLASHSLGIEAFARLRARTITNSAPLLTDQPTETLNTQETAEPLIRIVARTTPTELYTDMTVRIPSHSPRPQTIHKYMASVDLLQKQILIRSLASQECLVELVERDSLGGADLIIDPHTAVIFTCLLSLPACCNKLLERLSAQSWRYKRVLIVFEAYPESRSFRQRPKDGLTEPEPELYAYTPPIVKAIKRFRRNLAIAEGCGKKSTACDVWYAFANSVSDAATYSRLFGDGAERADWTRGVLWGDRAWLDADESQVRFINHFTKGCRLKPLRQDEKDLASFSGMNHFSAALVLYQITLQEFLDVTPEERLTMVGPLIGNEAITTFNLEIEERMRVMYDGATDVLSEA
ncbi:hypothetical protein C0989_003129 [Termitomyces sp. Mn162]|nr:hypothetical protein C0989_003129 [Termitomyces sp. Mn162]